MGHVTSAVSVLRSALDDVPSVLLDEHLQRVLADARTAIDTLEVFTPTPSLLVVVGPAGSGKSTVVNAIVGATVAAVSPVRPTTTAVTAVVGSGPSPVDGVTEYLITEHMDPGIAVVDTPPWDSANNTVKEALRTAAMAIVVVTPMRYGDEATRQAIEAASEADELRLIVNRLPPDAGLREQIEDAIHERLEIEPYATFSEGSDVEIDRSFVASIPIDEAAAGRRRILESAVGGLSRRIATGLTEAATQVGALTRALESVPDPSVGSVQVDGLYDWDEAREELVRVAFEAQETYDMDVERSASGELAGRIREQLVPPDKDTLAAALDDWLHHTLHRFRRRASIRFRKKSGRVLLDRWARVLSIDPDANAPRRVRRMMRDAFEPTVRKSNVDLMAVVTSLSARRPQEWAQLIDTAGEYRPGMLFAAATAIDGKATDGKATDRKVAPDG